MGVLGYSEQIDEHLLAVFRIELHDCRNVIVRVGHRDTSRIPTLNVCSNKSHDVGHVLWFADFSDRGGELREWLAIGSVVRQKNGNAGLEISTQPFPG